MDGSAHREGLQPLFYATCFRADQVADAARNVEQASFAGLAELAVQAPHKRKCVIVGAAPSARNYIEAIRAHKEAGALVFAVNDMHDYLIGKGVIPDGLVLHEIVSLPLSTFATPHPEVTYYVASWCDPAWRAALIGYNVKLWHGASGVEPVYENAIERCFPNSPRVMGGYATLHRTLNIMFAEGGRDFALYGFDCSHEAGGDTHAPKRNFTYAYPEIEVLAEAIDKDGTVLTKRFTSRAPLVRQADEFRRHCLYHHDKFKLRVHGDGLVPWMHRTMFPSQYEGDA